MLCSRKRVVGAGAVSETRHAWPILAIKIAGRKRQPVNSVRKESFVSDDYVEKEISRSRKEICWEQASIEAQVKQLTHSLDDN